MHARLLRNYLIPREAEQDPGFRDYILDLTHRGLRVIAWIEMVFPLFTLAGRISTATAEKREELLAMLRELCVTVRDSSERLCGTIARIQRFTNLDRAEVQSIDLNVLLQDVLTMFQLEAKKNVRMQVQLQTLPRLVCRPQQLSGVFSTLIGHAIHVAGEGGAIRLTTQHRDEWIDISLQEEGGGISSSELAEIFDLNFRVSENRISSGNWNLFSSRHFVREHGGDRMISRFGKTGLTVTVTLPWNRGLHPAV